MSTGADTAPITIQIFGDVEDIKKKLQVVQASIGTLDQQAKAHAEGVAGAFGKMGEGAKGASGAVSSGVFDMVTKLKHLVVAVLAAVGVYKLFHWAVRQAHEGMAEASAADSATAQFETILGSAEKAAARVKMLGDFNSNSIFSFQEAVQGNKRLELVTNGMFSGVEAMKLVGNVSAATGTSFTAMSQQFGRAFATIQSGGDVGRAVAGLAKMNVITPQTRKELKDLQEQGAKGPAIWAALLASLNRFSGGMERASQTWAGKLAILHHGWEDLQKSMMAPFQEAMKPILDKLITMVQGLKPLAEEAGAALGRAAQRLVQVVEAMKTLFYSGQLGSVVMDALTVAFKVSINYLAAGLVAIFQFVTTMLIESFKMLGSPDFWFGLLQVFAGIGNLLKGAVSEFIAKMIDGTRSWLDPIATALTYFSDKVDGGLRVAVTWFAERLLQAAADFLHMVAKAPFMSGVEKWAVAADAASKKMHSELEYQKGRVNKTWSQTATEAKAAMDELAASFHQTGRESGKEGASQLADGGKAVAQITLDAMKKALADASEGAKNTGKILDPTAELKRLTDTLAPLFPALAEVTKPIPAPENQKISMETEARRKGGVAIGDSLTAIGGGGGVFGGGMQDIAQRQLDVQERMADGIDELVDSSNSGGLTSSVSSNE